MNIIDTRANNTFNFVKRKNIKNIPLFELSFIEHSIDISSYTNVIFQSTPSVKFFNRHEDLRDKNVFAMGPGCLLYTSPSPRDRTRSRMPSSA